MNEYSDADSPTGSTRRTGLSAYRRAVFTGICAAVILLGMTTYRLERPGVFYDEVHQATGAFAYIGRPTTLFSLLPIRGLPLLNMPYTGAIKTAIYGGYLRVSGRPFSISSWRLLGIIFSACGIVVFALLAGHRLSPGALGLFFALLLTDTDFLLQTRHDWGPAALGFLIRMTLIGVWLRHQAAPVRPARTFSLGLIVGIAIFEKVTSTVLVAPLAIMLWTDRRTRSLRDAAYAAAGIGVGAFPVIAANLYWLATRHMLLVSSSLDTLPGRGLVGYAANVLAIGNGGIERRMIFDAGLFRWTEWLEGSAFIGLTLVIAAVAWTRPASDPRARLAGAALACYIAVAIALRWLPHRTAEQHWIVGTPFQYIAVALAAAALWSTPSTTARARRVLVLCLTALLIARVPPVVSAFEAVRDDRYSLAWDPSLNMAAAFIARQPDHAVFIAANWGTAAQVFCVANGRQDFVVEPFTHYQGHVTMNRILDGRTLAVVAAVKPWAPGTTGLINPQRQVTQEIFDNISTTPNWEEVPIGPSVQNLRAVEIHLFRRTDGGAEQSPPLRR